MEDKEQGVWLDNVACLDCGSSDNLSIYEKPDGSVDGYCRTIGCPAGQFKSNNKLAKDEELVAQYDIKKINKRGSETMDKPARRLRRRDKTPKTPITKEEGSAIWSKTTFKGKNFRDQDDSILKDYGFRTEYDGSGAVKARYYPIHKGKKEDGSLNIVGYKKRIVLPKKGFMAIGLNDETVDLIGEEHCKGSGRIVLVGGEEDLAAAKKIINKQRKAHHKIIDVVCTSHSETAQYKQIKNKYDFFDKYDEIIVAMDDGDENGAGDLATEKLLEILPPSKTKIMTQPANDSNECLQKGLTKEWLEALYEAKRPAIAGITGSSDLLEDMFQSTSFEKCPLPACYTELNTMLEGGYDFGTFNIIAGDTSVGKTTHVNEISTYIIDKGLGKPIILSLEAKKSVLARQYLSLKLGKRLGSFKSEEDLREYVGKHQEQVDGFLHREGEDTFEVIDDRARLASIEDTFNMIERAIRSLDCRVIIIDPASDLTDSLTNEQQAIFNSRIKALMAEHSVIIIGIYHTRKLDGLTKEGKRRIRPSRYDIYGSKTTINSATTILLLWRDADAEDETERNTTYMSLDKNRDHAITGLVPAVYYDKETHKLHNRDDWLASQVEDI